MILIVKNGAKRQEVNGTIFMRGALYPAVELSTFRLHATHLGFTAIGILAACLPAPSCCSCS